MDDFDKWEFDIFKYFSLLEDATIIHFGFKLFHSYGLLDKFSIADNNFTNLLNQIQNSFYVNSSYHNALRAIEVTRNFHYFIKKGELMNYLSDLNLMAGFLACFTHDVGHPGVTNSFLIATSHSKAIRYNDKSVLENHHLALSFKLLLDPQNDIFESLSEAQYWNVRQIIIRMILSTDISQHFEQISKSSYFKFSVLQRQIVNEEIPRRQYGG
jgi:cAMP-specific phosphodiesterase 4